MDDALRLVFTTKKRHDHYYGVAFRAKYIVKMASKDVYSTTIMFKVDS